MIKFYAPSCEDKRVFYAGKYLIENGYDKVDSLDKCDFVLMGVNPKSFQDYTSKPLFAGNVFSNNVYDYTKNEVFALENAYLTAEGALSLAVASTDQSLVGSSALLLGYGRISKALLSMLKPLTNDITICARSSAARQQASLNGARVLSFDELDTIERYDYVFNTVPSPVLEKSHLQAAKKDTLVMDLASFPGGVDKHYARIYDLKFLVANSLPAKFSPKASGVALAKAVISMIEAGEAKI